MSKFIYIIRGKQIEEFPKDSCYEPDAFGNIIIYHGRYGYEQIKKGQWFKNKRAAEEKING